RSAEPSADALVGEGRIDPPDLDAAAGKQSIEHVAPWRVSQVEVDARTIGTEIETAVLVAGTCRTAHQCAGHAEHADQKLQHAPSNHGRPLPLLLRSRDDRSRRCRRPDFGPARIVRRTDVLPMLTLFSMIGLMR